MFWNTKRIAEVLQLHTPAQTSEIIDIVTDSRKVKPGSLFVAYKGDAMDGHDFIDSAIQSGAAAILTEKDVVNPGKTIVFKVPSTLNALRRLAHVYRKSFQVPFIGVVGSVGKTTTKELIYSILQGKYSKVQKTEGSQNGFLGIPITLLSISPDCEVAVIEIGIDDIGAMEQHLALV